MPKTQQMAKQPNILLFVTDDHGQWAGGPYGNRELRTPNLDRLAASGVVMENAFTPTPVCSPARASLLTGLTPSQHGIHDYIAMRFDRRDWLARVPTLPQLLQKAGYRTGMCGKWHLGNEDRPAPGFDCWFSIGSAYPVHHCGTREFCDQGRMEGLRGWVDDIIAERAAKFLRHRDARPFFLLVGLFAPHSPWDGHPPRLVDQYRDADFVDIPRGETYRFGALAGESLSVDRRREREHLAQYYAAVAHVDENVGRLLALLEDSGWRQNTLVVYTSDHGLNCGHHGVWGKGNGTLPLNMLEESIRVPLILSRPGILPAGARRDEMVDHLDLFQTLVAAAGAEIPPGYDYAGEDLGPLIATGRQSKEWRQVQFGEYGPLRMARTREHKLVRRFPNGPDELFDLAADPREDRNLIDDPGYRDAAAQLSAAIETYIGRYAATDRSGLLGAALPQHNLTEAWRR